MAVLDRPLDPSNSVPNAEMEALIDTAMEQRLDSAGGPVPAQITSRSPITQARTSRAQDSHDLEGTGIVKREDRSVLKYEAACNIRTPQLEAHGESMLAIPESNGRSFTGNAETAERGKLSAKATLKGSGHTTPLAAEERALPLCSTFSPVSSDGPIAIYSSVEGDARNVDQENSNVSIHAEVSLTKRKADAMQETCQSRNSHDCEEVETDEIEVQPTESSKKRQKIEHAQARDSDKLFDYANVPHIPFVDNANLPADIERRGYPRLIHIEHFTKETNTDNLTMADFVATILFHHNPQTLTAFFDEKRYPKFGFATRSPSKARDFAIERERKEHGLVVKVHASSLTTTRG